jgi:lysozyme
MLDVKKILDAGVPLIKKWEGFSATPYLCSAGVPTIGWGNTFYENGVMVTLSDPPITRSYADSLFLGLVKSKYLPEVLKACPTFVDETQAGAILSWTYNLGVASLRGSTMRKYILLQDWEEAASQLLKWNKAKGKVVLGLTRRRADEAKLFLSKV